jgi:S-adenosylmethionine:tRNA ribosyltransferase-isomerase
MNDPGQISISDFTYHLPDDKIALFPSAERDASRLLVYNNGVIVEDRYSNIAAHIQAGSLLVFNNSKVINARIRFKKSSGGTIEIFCLEPYELQNEYSTVMQKTGSILWKCFVGGAAKWKEGNLQKEMIINGKEIILAAALIEKLSDAYIVEFSWTPGHYSFAEIIEHAGNIPLPPYIKRQTDAADSSRYQTIYAMPEGSVAAPTAGLHFTENVFKKLKEKNIEHELVTLHVGAGTFKPVKASTMQEHEMHAEWLDVSMGSIKKILENHATVIAVGTTSLRTIESLYWLGVKTFLNPETDKPGLTQWEVYSPSLLNSNIPVEKALQSLINWMEVRNLQHIFTQTQLLITPGYKFRIAKALITNFHQPQSTLLLLVAAAIGDDWRKIYDYALNHDFRFLSYGDGNLLYINNT